MSLRPSALTARVRRFSRAERWVHRSTAVLMGLCILTAACLYVPQLAELVGRRELVVTAPRVVRLALPVPVLVGLASRAFRADLRLLNRFGPHDRTGCAPPCAATAAASRPAGKFNAGRRCTRAGSRARCW